MSNWISELSTNLAGELNDRPRVATLATVSSTTAGPGADARSIVIRELTEAGILMITSDARSEKNKQLRTNPSASVVFWLPTLRWQCVVSGDIAVIDRASTDPIRLEQWRKLSDATRAMFSWPSPGEGFDAAAEFKRATGPNVEPPDSFEVLMLKPTAVETLDVRAHPHRRVVWEKAGDQWQSRMVNP